MLSQLFLSLSVLHIVGVLYLAPSIVAKEYKHKEALAIFVLNLFLGWTLLGRVIALIWAVRKQ